MKQSVKLSIIAFIMMLFCGCESYNGNKILNPNYIESRGKWKASISGTDMENESINYVMYEGSPYALVVVFSKDFNLSFGAYLLYVGKESNYHNAKFDTYSSRIIFQTNDTNGEENFWTVPAKIDQTTIFMHSIISGGDDFIEFLASLAKSPKFIMKVALDNGQTFAFEFNGIGFRESFKEVFGVNIL